MGVRSPRKWFDGHTADPTTVGDQIDALKQRFRVSKVVLVGDRGRLTQARIRAEVTPAGSDWISALNGNAIRSLVAAGAIETSLFDEIEMAEIVSPDYPGERLMVCQNPFLATERRHHRQDLQNATEALLAPIAAAIQREKWRLKGTARIGVRVGKVINTFKVAKHFRWWLDAAGVFHHQRNADSITDEACLDGFDVIRTRSPRPDPDGAATVTAYKQLNRVECAFRSLKTVDLKVRPVFHRTEVRAHGFLCMLAMMWNGISSKSCNRSCLMMRNPTANGHPLSRSQKRPRPHRGKHRPSGRLMANQYTGFKP